MARFRKSVVAPGRHVSPDGVVDITPARIRRWIRDFDLMRRRGIKIPVPWGHQPDAIPMETEAQYQDAISRHNAGYVDSLEVDSATGELVMVGDAPGVEVDPQSGNLVHWVRGPDGNERKAAIQEVSLGINSWRSGDGTFWPDTIVHVALTPLPVWANQTGFAKMSTRSDVTYSIYKCPNCGGDAYNGDPKTGTKFRGSAECQKCGKGFAVIGMSPTGSIKPAPQIMRLSAATLGVQSVTGKCISRAKFLSLKRAAKLGNIHAIRTLKRLGWIPNGNTGSGKKRWKGIGLDTGKARYQKSRPGSRAGKRVRKSGAVKAFAGDKLQKRVEQFQASEKLTSAEQGSAKRAWAMLQKHYKGEALTNRLREKAGEYLNGLQTGTPEEKRIAKRKLSGLSWMLSQMHEEFKPEVDATASEFPGSGRMSTQSHAAERLRRLGWVASGNTASGKKRWKGTDEHQGKTRYQEKMPGAGRSKAKAKTAAPKKAKPKAKPKTKAKKEKPVNEYAGKGADDFVAAVRGEESEPLSKAETSSAKRAYGVFKRTAKGNILGRLQEKAAEYKRKGETRKLIGLAAIVEMAKKDGLIGGDAKQPQQSELPTPEPKPEPKPEAKPEAKKKPVDEPKAEPKAEPSFFTFGDDAPEPVKPKQKEVKPFSPENAASAAQAFSGYGDDLLKSNDIYDNLKKAGVGISKEQYRKALVHLWNKKTIHLKILNEPHLLPKGREDTAIQQNGQMYNFVRVRDQEAVKAELAKIAKNPEILDKVEAKPWPKRKDLSTRKLRYKNSKRHNGSRKRKTTRLSGSVMQNEENDLFDDITDETEGGYDEEMGDEEYEGDMGDEYADEPEADMEMDEIRAELMELGLDLGNGVETAEDLKSHLITALKTHNATKAKHGGEEEEYIAETETEESPMMMSAVRLQKTCESDPIKANWYRDQVSRRQRTRKRILDKAARSGMIKPKQLSAIRAKIGTVRLSTNSRGEANMEPIDMFLAGMNSILENQPSSDMMRLSTQAKLHVAPGSDNEAETEKYADRLASN